MQQIQIQTTCESMFETASEQMIDRELLYNKDSGILFVKYNGEMRQIGSKADNDNIILNEFGKLALADNIHCKTLTVSPDDTGLVYKDNVVLGTTTDERRIILLFRINQDADIGTMCGKLYEGTANCTSAYEFSASVTGSRYIKGSSNADVATYYKCTYQGHDYLGVMFNPNATIYFSGYELIPDGLEIDFDYNDSIYTKIVKLQDDADKGTSTEVINGSNAVSWDFDSFPEGLDSSNDTTTEKTEYDLTNGLYVNPDFEGTVIFRPTRIVNDDVGHIVLSGSGKALRLDTGKDRENLTIKIYFSSNATETRSLLISKGDSTTALQSVESSSETDMQVLTQKLDADTTYYFGSSGSRIRIYKVVLTYTKRTLILHGWDAFNNIWEFTSTPSGWNQGTEVDFDNGLVMYRYDNANYNMYTNEVGQTRSGENNRGYVVCRSSKQDIFYYDNPNDETTLSVMFCTGQDGGYRTLTIYNEAKKNLASAGNRYQAPTSWSNDTGLTIVTATNLPKGRYYINASAELKIWQISVSNAGKEDSYDYSDNVSVSDVTDTIVEMEETGENGDAHYLTITDLTLTLSDLNKIANELRNSDKKVHLDLSDCTVADDATSWTNIFNKCTSLTYFALPQGVKKLGINTFVGCLFLEKIVLPDSLTSFEGNSNYSIFSGTRIRTMVLPKTFKSLGVAPFSNSGLRHLVIRPDTETHFIDMCVYSSMFETLDYVKIHMTPSEKSAHDYTLDWEHRNYFGDTVDNTIESHISEYTDLDELLDELNYGD